MSVKRVFGILVLLTLFAVNMGFAKKAKDFTLKDVNGKEVSLSDYEGKVVLVNFWAVWCPPCLAEMPDLNKLYTNYKDKDFVILGLTVSSKNKKIPGKIKETGVTYPILVDADSQVENFGGFRSIPQTFIINKEGEIVQQLSGSHPYETFEKAIKKHL